MFFTRANHNEKERKETEAGKKTRLTFRWTYDDRGNKSLVQDEEIDRDAEIQSYLEETKIENIINRAAFDPSIVQKLGAQLSDKETQDFTNMPSTLAEAQNLMIQAENTWNKFPSEIKQKFDNDVNKFIARIGTADWMEALGLNQKSVIDEKPMNKEKTVKE
nr:MAG TPA: Scaffold protein [Microviridae sp.]